MFSDTLRASYAQEKENSVESSPSKTLRLVNTHFSQLSVYFLLLNAGHNNINYKPI